MSLMTPPPPPSLFFQRRSSERLPGAVKYQRVDAKSAEPVGPARKKPAAKVGVKKSTSDASVAQPARPAKRKSAEGEPPAVKKSRTEDASAKPVRLAKAASMEGAAAEQKKGVSKKVPSKEKMEFAVPKTKPKFNPVIYQTILYLGCLVFLFVFFLFRFQNQY